MKLSPERWLQLSPLLDELLELDAGARARRLSELARVDASLGADLRELLAADARASGVLDHGVAQIAATVVTQLGVGTAPQAFLPDSGVGPYRIVRLLGRGGMGEVYLARRSEEGFEQDVALKLLKRGMDSDEVLRRFMQERRILAQLNHPHVAHFLDGGVSADGRPYFAMEYVDGQTLTQFARTHALGLRERVNLLIAVCDAVAYAHSRLIVHRDLKPSNILVDASAQPRVLDFGIAKLLGDGEAANATMTGNSAMSPAYAAPEQILGEPVGTATDVYALGVIAFELFTGSLPHRRAAGSQAALAQELLQESTTRPSQALRQTATDATTGIGMLSAARVARELAGDLDTIVLTALQREPPRRYLTPAAMADDLRRWLAGRPIAARADTARYRISKFVRRHRGSVAASLISVVALIGATGFSLWQARIAHQQAVRADVQTQRAESEAASARQQAERMRRVKDFLVSIFVQEDPLRHTPGGAITLAQAFDDTLKRIDSELGADPALQADLLDDFGEITTTKGNFEQAQRLFERALELAEKSHGPNDPAVAESLVNLGVLANYRGESLQGKPRLERAVAILAPHAQELPGEYATALAALAGVVHLEGNLPESARMFREVLQIQRQRHAGPDLMIAALSNVASGLIVQGKYTEAEPLAREALSTAEAAYGKQSPQVIPPIWSLEDIAYWRGDYAEEERLVERRLEIARAVFPPTHPWVVTALGESGFLLTRNNRVAEGEARMRQAMGLLEQAENTGEEMQSIERRLWISLQHRGEPAAALAVIEKAWLHCQQHGKATAHKLCLTIRANRALSQAENGQGQRALTEADAVGTILRAQFGEHSDEYAQALEARAAALLALHRRDEAVVAQRQAVATFEAVYGANHGAVKAARTTLARIERG